MIETTAMIVFSRATIRIGEVYFSEERKAGGPRVDLVRFIGVLHPRERLGWTLGHTLLIDLAKDSDTLLREMDSGTRYEIKRAQSKDSLMHDRSDAPSPQMVESFCDHYDEFAKSKSLRSIFRLRMHELARREMLLLSAMSTGQGQVLVQHAHLMTAGRVMLLYSASKFREINDSTARALVGRANRLLHWQDMMTAKERGISVYDICGVDITNRSPETSRIAQFKQGFGGKLVPVFGRSAADSLKGILVKTALKLLGKNF